MAQMAEQCAQEPGPDVEPSLVLNITQKEHLFGSLAKWVRIAHSNEEGAASNIQRDLRGTAPIWCWEGRDATTYPSP